MLKSIGEWFGRKSHEHTFVNVGVWTTDIASFKEASGGAEKPLLQTIRERCTIWGKERTRSEYTKANQ